MRWGDWQNTPFTLPLLLIGLLCARAAYVGWRRRAFPGAAPFAVLMAALAGWTLVNLVEKSLVDHDARRAVSAFIYVFIVTVPGAWLVFAASFATLDRWIPRWLVPLLFVEPVFVLAMVFTNSLHGLFRTATEMRTEGPYAVMVITQGPFFFVNAAYTYLLFTAGAVLLVAAVARRPGATTARVVVVLGAMLVPVLGNVAYVCGWQSERLTDLTPVYFAVPALAAAWLLFRVRVFDVLPVARDFVLDCLGDAVFVLDTHSRILDANVVARALLPDLRRVRKQPLADVLPELSGCLPARPGAPPAHDDGGGATEIRLRPTGPDRFWDVHVLPLADQGVTIGTLVRLTEVTERKRAAARSQLAAIVESSEDAIIGNTLAGVIVSWNPGAERLYGYAAGEVRGRPLSLLFPPDQPDEVPEIVERLRQGKRIEHYEVVHVRKDGRRVDVSLSISPIRDAAGAVTGASVIARDVTDRKRAEAALQVAERRFRALVENTWDGVTLLAADGTVLYTNPAVQRNLGYTPEEFVNRDALELMHPDDRPLMRSLLAQLVQQPGGRLTAQYRMLHRDGSWRWREGTGTNLLAEPSVRAVVVNYRDITERRLMEEELRQRARQLTEADRRKDEFLAMLGHELRNPLAPLRTAIEVVKTSGTGEPHAEQACRMMERQLGQLARLVDDLLDVSRITLGKIQLHKEPVELAAVIALGLETSRPLVDARGQELIVSVPAERLCLEADPTRLAQVVGNLLNNAAKYTAEGGRIWLTAERQNDQAVLRVRDSGIGMAEEMLTRAFDLFAQGDQALDRRHGGLGIGLTVVRSLVQMHGGSVQAFSDGPGKGSEFVVRLPLVRRTLPAIQGPKGRSGLRPSRRILVVDDNVDAAESLALFLGMNGHEVRTAFDGPAALELARTCRPEVVVLDIGMPGMDGYEVARRLRQEPGLGSVLLVALTGYGQEQDRRRSREAAIDHHLVKPVDPQALRALLARTESPAR
jgi:two-component system CheB/CheR fusion protein